MKKVLFLGALAVLLIIGLVYGEHIGIFTVVPNADATEVFSVYNAARDTRILNVDATNTQVIVSANGLNIRDDAIEVKSPSDGVLGIYSDGGGLIDVDDSLSFKIGTPTIVFDTFKLDTGTAGSNYDSLLIVVSVNGSTGGTADYDTIWIPIAN